MVEERVRRVTIADVAARAGVSPGAVSFALNDRPGVAESTRRHILDVAAELDWTPNLRARSLSRSRAFALGLVLARSPETLGADPFFPAFIAGVETVLSEVGQSLVLTVVPDAQAEATTYRRLANEGRVDGVFLTDLRRADPRIELLRELRLPTVTLGRPDVGSPFPAVVVDDAPGFTALVENLISRGHTSIAHVCGPMEFLHVRSRRAAWRTTLRRAGLTPGPVVAGDFSAASGAAATAKLLDRPARPTAIVYGNDVMAIAGMAVAQQRGLKLPGQLSITGFDDIGLACHVHPPLTTVRSNPFDWGQGATRVLLAAVDGRPAPDLDLPPAQLVLRGSVARAPTPRTPKTAPIPKAPSARQTAPRTRQESS
jgi:DNA-binding LacI/PurR family transcriptional regulator